MAKYTVKVEVKHPSPNVKSTMILHYGVDANSEAEAMSSARAKYGNDLVRIIFARKD